MELDEKGIVLAAAAFAVAGILLLLLFSETPKNASAAQALIEPENTLVIVTGQAQGVGTDKFSLCDIVCISVRSNGLATAGLLENGRQATVTGRVMEYQGNRYMEAEKIEVT